MPIGRFLGGISALIRHPDNDTYLILRRSARKDVGAGHWGCVTGRVDQGEGFETALHREVREEIGVEITVEFIIATTHFYRGDPLPENELLGVHFCCAIADPAAITISPEHDAHRWATAAAVHALLGPDHWLTQVIHRAESLRARMPADLLTFLRAHSLEI